MQNILVVNAGSSSIKLAVFAPDLEMQLSAEASGIGGTGRLRVGDSRQETALATHALAFDKLLEQLAARGFTPGSLAAAGHRVVHGGESLTRPELVTPEVLAEIGHCARLAPLHNPHNAAAIRALADLMPQLPQVACFDTAFHAANPEPALRYALPGRPETQGIRRYGFHGISYAALVRRWPEVTGTALPKRLLAMHLGNGASLCAIREGRSVATTMGYSPLEGLTMGTRAGSIDGNAVLALAETLGVDGARRLLNHESGLLGLSGLSPDMRALEAADTPAARFAIEHFCYWAARHAGSMIAAMEGIDAIAFTGGIGENAAAIRADITKRLAWAGLPDGAVNVIPADEERQIAWHTRNTLDLPGT
ncbi:acetate/propionate family kinase [Cribrihabitans neustonicus]|uniref:acetate/propionate family kinase n=1 Tax=Cribrihabitans neustonicus TaxID=1429085 RepID=UPI003B594928